MTHDDHLQTVARYRAAKGKATPAEYMAYMWARQALGEAINSGQRGFLAAAQKPHWHRDAPKQPPAPVAAATPVRAFAAPPAISPQPHPADDVPAWATQKVPE